MGVLGDPFLADSLPPEHHRRSSGTVKRFAAFGVAGGLEHCHAHCREAVARDDGAQIIQTPAELVDMTPDVTPLLLLGCLPTNSEGSEGPKGDDVCGEERTGAREIHCLNAELELLKPAADQGNIIVLLTHVSLQGWDLEAEWCACPRRASSRPQALLSP